MVANLVAVAALPVVFWFNVSILAAAIVPELILLPSRSVTFRLMFLLPSNEAIPAAPPDNVIFLAVANLFEAATVESIKAISRTQLSLLESPPPR